MLPKLVRDKIPEIIIKDNCEPITHIASDSEYWQELKNKLLEEVNEFLEDESVEELADVMEVINSIKKYKKISNLKLEFVRNNKLKQRGGFDKKIVLDKINKS